MQIKFISESECPAGLTKIKISEQEWQSRFTSR